MPKRLFGTDGIRDIANSGHLTPDIVLTIGRIIGYKLRTSPQFFWYEGTRAPDWRDRSSHGKSLGAGKVAIGTDTRISGPLISSALEAGLLSQGVDLIDLGVAPTPVVASMTNQWGCIMGIVISASHNPMEYNGIKLFNGRGLKMPQETERKLEAEIGSGAVPMNYPIGDRIGKRSEHTDYFDDYIEMISRRMSLFPSQRPLAGIKVAIDAANGAAFALAPWVIEQLGASVVPINCSPDGRNINRACGALHPETVREAVLREGADLGIALDGDADRAILVDAGGNTVDGDFMLAVAAKFMKERGKLTGDAVVSTVMANLGLEIFLREIGVQLIRVPVGDRFVLEKMIDGACRLGGEQSGHLVFLDYANTGDGILTSLKIISIMKETELPLAELASIMRKLPQVLLNVPVHPRAPLESMPAVQEAAAAARAELGEDGRLVLRYSGTESIARVMIEGLDSKQINRLAESIAAVIKRELG